MRQSGRTTRLIDYYVQRLFSDGYIRPRDHYVDVFSHTERQRRDSELTHKIRKRLQFEHPHIFNLEKLVLNNEYEIGFRKPNKSIHYESI